MSDVIFSILFLVLYIAEVVFFVYITFKCFIDKFSIGKSILLAIISPASGFFVAYILATLFLGDDLRWNGSDYFFQWPLPPFRLFYS